MSSGEHSTIAPTRPQVRSILAHDLREQLIIYDFYSRQLPNPETGRPYMVDATPASEAILHTVLYADALASLKVTPKLIERPLRWVPEARNGLRRLEQEGVVLPNPHGLGVLSMKDSTQRQYYADMCERRVTLPPRGREKLNYAARVAVHQTVLGPDIWGDLAPGTFRYGASSDELLWLGDRLPDQE